MTSKFRENDTMVLFYEVKSAGKIEVAEKSKEGMTWHTVKGEIEMVLEDSLSSCEIRGVS